MTEIPVNLYADVFPRLNVAEIDVVEGAAGPGHRLVIWLQGCLKRCPGCANAVFLPERPGQLLTVADLLERLAACEPCDGVTLSGGEPVLQAAALLPFLQAVRQRGSTVMCYSGYSIEELTAPSQHAILKEFLSYVDLLVDGEYKSELPRAGVYRPTANQRLHFLSGRIRPDACDAAVETVFDIRSQQVSITGTLPSDLRRQLFAKLRHAGIHLKLR